MLAQMSRNTIIVIVVILVIVAGGWFMFRPQTTVAPTPTVESTPVATTKTPAPATESAMMEKNEVTVSASGFSPKSITIKVGDSVTWVNTDNAVHNVSSAPHPQHTAYPPLNLGNIQPEGQVSLVFPNAGTYRYHNHLTPSLTGSVTVQ